MLAQTNELYYLHPSFGYYFEQFYLEPHGLVYKMKTLPDDTLLPPLPDKNLIAENEDFWTQVGTPSVGCPSNAPSRRPIRTRPRVWGERLLDASPCAARTESKRRPGRDFLFARPGFLGRPVAARRRTGKGRRAVSTTAQELNPDNVVAQINLRFNQTLRAGRTVPVDLSKVTADQFGKYHDWNEVVNANGPFDEPSFCF